MNKVNKDTPPYISDDFQIGPDGAYEHNEIVSMSKVKIKAAVWTLIVLMVLALLMLGVTIYPIVSSLVVIGLSSCVFVWATYNIILNKLKNKNE